MGARPIHSPHSERLTGAAHRLISELGFLRGYLRSNEFPIENYKSLGPAVEGTNSLLSIFYRLAAKTALKVMPRQRDQVPGLDSQAHGMPLQPIYPLKRSRTQSTAPPPPYTGPPTPTVSEEALPLPHMPPRDSTPIPRLPNSHESSRRLPIPPRIDTSAGRATASPNQPLPPSSQVTGLQPPALRSSRVTIPSTSLLGPSLSPQSHNSPSQLPPSAPIVKSRSFNPLSVLKLHKSTRKATELTAKQTARRVTDETRARTGEEEAARQAAERDARERDEESARKAGAQAEARELVRSSIESLLLQGLSASDEERTSVFSQCFRACKGCSLNLSAVLQEPLIEGQLPVYWAILNRPPETPEVDDEALNALISTLLNTSGSLNESTIDSVRLACMWTSNNTLLQHLFWRYPELSPLSMSDRMLLGSFGGDAVDVGETRDGTGAFVARVKIRRFRLRMNSSKVIKIEFITFGRFFYTVLSSMASDFCSNAERIWTARFFVRTERIQEGVSESRWLFSLELANNSTPAWVDADLIVPGHPHQTTNSDTNEPVFSIAIGCVGHALQPGPENAIKVRLDDGPMRLHWINEFVNIQSSTPFIAIDTSFYSSLTLLDTEGTLHVEFHVKLTQPPMVPPVPALSPDISDTWSQVSSVPTPYASSSYSEPPKSPTGRRKEKVKREKPDKPVYTSLRHGGRYK